MIRSIATAAFVIAAMALGRLITDYVPLDDGVNTPFVHEASTGTQVALEFADVEVTTVQVTPTLIGSPAAKAGGRWVLVSTRLTATRTPTIIPAPTLINAAGDHFLPTSRGTDCAASATLPTGIPWEGSFCFDVPRAALDGARVLIARGDYGDEGDGFRRDDVAEIDLGLTDPDALWDSTEPADITPYGVTVTERDS